MSDYRFSIVIAVDEDSGNLEKCLKSALRQGGQEVQLILSGMRPCEEARMLARRYSERHTQFHFLDENFQTYPAAFNAGLRCASGEYISFLTPRGWLAKNALRELEAFSQRSRPDILIGRVLDIQGAERFYPEHGNLYRYHNLDISLKDMPELLMDRPICNKWFSRAFLCENGLGFEEDSGIGGWGLNIRALRAATSITLLPVALFCLDHASAGPAGGPLEPGAMAELDSELRAEVGRILDAKNRTQLSSKPPAASREGIPTRALRFMVRKLKKAVKGGITAYRKGKFSLAYRIVSRRQGPHYVDNRIWLFAERQGKHIGDNAYELFDHIRREESAVDPWFIVNRNSPSLANVEDRQGVVYSHSWKHYCLLVRAKVFVFTDKFYDFTNNPEVYRRVNLDHGANKRFFAMMHHGCMYLKKTAYRNYRKTNFGVSLDLFAALSDYDRQLIIKHSGHQEQVVRITGYPRFDTQRKNSVEGDAILFFPTWRRALDQCSRADFLRSDYYRSISSLLSHPRLMEYLDASPYRIDFCLHFRMKEFVGNFTGAGKNVRIISPENMNLTQLMQESRLLITDYSSIAFDYVYMDKPVILYEFGLDGDDGEDQGPINPAYRDEIFCRVVSREEELVSRVIDYMDNDFCIEQKYLERRKKFFAAIDTDNCKRVYTEISRSVFSK